MSMEKKGHLAQASDIVQQALFSLFKLMHNT